MEDLVSVIMPNFNCAKFIDKSIRSVLEQSYSNLELIIVDDNSSDDSLSIVDGLAKKDSRIRVIKNKFNKGAAFCRNLAIWKARGEWIAFLDSDDLWEKNKLKKQLNFMKSNDYHFSYTSYKEIDENDNNIGKIIKGPKFLNKKKMYRYCYPGCLTVMYDRKYVGLVQIPISLKKNNDYAIWLKVIEKTNCYFLDECLGSYRKRANSISSGKKLSLIKYHYKMFRNGFGMNPFESFFRTLINLFFGVQKKIKYVENIKK